MSVQGQHQIVRTKSRVRVAHRRFGSVAALAALIVAAGVAVGAQPAAAAVATTVQLTSSPNPSDFGETVVLTARVESSVQGCLAGTVAFNSPSGTLGTRPTVLNTDAGLNGRAEFSISTLNAGSTTLAAFFTPSDAGCASSGDGLDSPQVVLGIGTTTHLTSSLNPSDPGDSVVFSARVVSSEQSCLDGTVEFSDGSATLGTRSTVLNTDGGLNGRAQLTTSALAGGEHSISATFTPTNPNCAGSPSNVVSQGVNGAPQITLQPVGIIVDEGQTATFTAAATGYPTPTVQWWRNGPADPPGGFLPIDGATSTSYSLTATAADQQANFYATFTNLQPDGLATVQTIFATLTVQLYQTITFPTIATHLLGDTDFSPGATATSGLGVTYASTTAAVCTIVGQEEAPVGKVHLVGVGTCTVNADQRGSPLWNPAPQVSRSFQVKQVVPVTVTGSQTYGGSASFSRTGSAPSGLTFSGTVVCTRVDGGTAINALLGAGSYFVDPGSCSGLSLTGSGASNYVIVYSGTHTVSKASLIVTPNPASGPYGTIPAVTPSYSGFKNNQTAAVLTTAATCQSNTTITTLPGTYTNRASCSGAVADNYSFTYHLGTVTIVKAAVTLQASSTTAAASSAVGRMTFTTIATNTSSHARIAGLTVTITVRINAFYSVKCVATTNAQGVATCASGNGNLLLIRYPHPYTATTPATSLYSPGATTGTIKPV